MIHTEMQITIERGALTACDTNLSGATGILHEATWGKRVEGKHTNFNVFKK